MRHRFQAGHPQRRAGPPARRFATLRGACAGAFATRHGGMRLAVDFARARW